MRQAVNAPAPRRPGLLAFLAGGMTKDATPPKPKGNRAQRRAKAARARAGRG